jgi:hypothetical protein
MNLDILWILIAGSTLNLAFEDIFSKRIIPKPSFLVNIFLIIAYLSFQPIYLIVFLVFLALIWTTKQRYIGLADAGVFLIFVNFNPLLAAFSFLPALIFVILTMENKHEFSVSIALYLSGVALQNV